MAEGLTTSISLNTSRETVWRHLTRISDWPDWYPGLMSVEGGPLITGADAAWTMRGLMGRLPYHSQVRVVEYQIVRSFRIEEIRSPWRILIRQEFTLRTDGSHVVLDLTVTGQSTHIWPLRRLIDLYACRAIRAETAEIVDRFGAYVARALPYD